MTKHERNGFQTEGSLRTKAPGQALHWQVKAGRRPRAYGVIIAKRREQDDRAEGGQTTDDAELFRPQEKLYCKKRSDEV